MTGACHHLSPAPVFIDDRFRPIGCSFDCWCKDTKIFCIYQIFACDKERFSAKHLRFETSLKNGLCFLWGASLCFCGVENYVLPYKSAYYEVIPDYMETYSVFSIQFFFAHVTILCIDSILYIIYNIK